MAASVISASGFSLSLAAPAADPATDPTAGRPRTAHEWPRPTTPAGTSPEPAEARLRPDPAYLLELLRQALRTADEGERRLASRLFGLLPIEHRPLGALVPMPGFEPAEAQRRALQLALDREALFVVGPPGTGKTATLAAMAYQFVRQGLSVLVTAHTNVAVDHALAQLAALCEASPGAAPLVDGRIVRVGVPRADSPVRQDLLLSEIVARRTGGTRGQVETLVAQQEHLRQDVAAIELEQERRMRAWNERRERLEQERHAAQAEAKAGEERERGDRERVVERLRAITGELATARESARLRGEELAGTRERVARARGAHAEAAEAQSQASDDARRAQSLGVVARLARRVRLADVERRLADANDALKRAGEELSRAEQALDRAEREYALASQRATDLQRGAEIAARARPGAAAEARRAEESRARAATLAQQLDRGDDQARQFSEANERRLGELRQQHDVLTAQVRALHVGLADVEQETLDGARVIGTTLTRVYSDRRMRERRFDVVIVDEVSAAPLPAVYVAASRADRRVVVVGDPQQLPPIAKTKDERGLEWLGRDIFAHRGITIEDASAGRKHSAMLDEQRRMHPAIAALVRQHVYAGKLRDHPDLAAPDPSPADVWPGGPLALCDTSDASPTCLRSRGSRINLYSAVCAFLIGCRLAADLRGRRDLAAQDGPTTPPARIPVGIVAPYAAQATLLQRLIRDAGLEGEMRAGTAHRFQGLECEALIVDAVESEPLPPTDLTRGGLNSQAMRLLNVAVTRARRRLVLVANATYLRQRLGDSHSLRLAIEQAAAASLLPSAELMTATGPLLFAGARGAASGAELLDGAAFGERLQQDLAAARRSVTLVSPFVTEARARLLADALSSASRRGVSVEAITRPAGARAGDVVHERGFALLRSIGVRLRAARDLHAKAIWIDETVAYVGSLNVLSYGGATHEVMLRIESADLVRTLRETIAAFEAQARGGEPPI